MADYTKYTKQEMQAYAIAKNIKENQIVIVTSPVFVNRCFSCEACGLPELPPDRRERTYGLLTGRGTAFRR